MRKLATIWCAALAVACSGSETRSDGDPLLLTAVTAGSGFTCGLQADSTAWCWGANQYGQLGAASSDGTCKVDPVATGQCSVRPVAVSGGHEFVAIDAGESHACALARDGQAFCWGDNASGQLGNVDSSETCVVEYYVQRGYGPTLCSRTPRAVNTELRFASISSASGFTCALTRDGAAHCWGKWTNARMGGVEFPIAGGPIARTDADPFTQISADGGRACALTSAGRILCWGGSGAVLAVPLFTSIQFARVSRGWRHACGVARDSTAHCWGENDSGQLGNGAVNPRFNSGDSSVYRVDGDVRFHSIDAGFLSTCASSTDGAQFCWGDGSVIAAASPDRCAHADATSACALRPIRTTLENVVAMASGFMHRCALVEGGRAYCWGYNESHAVSADSSRMLRAPTLVVR